MSQVTEISGSTPDMAGASGTASKQLIRLPLVQQPSVWPATVNARKAACVVYGWKFGKVRLQVWYVQDCSIPMNRMTCGHCKLPSIGI